mgnify:CR=1 FL=1
MKEKKKRKVYYLTASEIERVKRWAKLRSVSESEIISKLINK